MPLTLKIISKQKHILGADSVRVFSVRGGSVGRAPDNDWVLPDPDRFISGHHATIEYRDGAYYLNDTSTNGVFLNRARHPVGHGTPIRLHDGDELRMGDYLFRATLIQVSQHTEELSGPRLRRKEEDPGSLSLKLLSEQAEREETAGERAERALSGHGSDGDNMLSTVRVTDTGIDSPTDVDREKVAALREQESAQLGMNDDLQLAPGQDLAAKEASWAGTGDFAAAVRLLLEEAGLDPSEVPGDQQERIVTLAGQFIRTATESLRALLAQRAEVCSQYRINPPGFRATGNNPLVLMATTQEALEQMFYPRDEGEPDAYLDAIAAVDEVTRDLRRHQVATIKALHAAFRELLNRLEPGRLEERFQQGPTKGGGLLSGAHKPRHWDLYKEAYHTIAGFADESFPTVLGADFAEAYNRETQAAGADSRRKKRR